MTPEEELTHIRKMLRDAELVIRWQDCRINVLMDLVGTLLTMTQNMSPEASAMFIKNNLEQKLERARTLEEIVASIQSDSDHFTQDPRLN